MTWDFKNAKSGKTTSELSVKAPVNDWITSDCKFKSGGHPSCEVSIDLEEVTKVEGLTATVNVTEVGNEETGFNVQAGLEFKNEDLNMKLAGSKTSFDAWGVFRA